MIQLRSLVCGEKLSQHVAAAGNIFKIVPGDGVETVSSGLNYFGVFPTRLHLGARTSQAIERNNIRAAMHCLNRGHA